MNKNNLSIRVRGGRPLKGTMPVAPNKNAVLVLIAASMLSTESVIIRNVPKSPDVLKILQAIEELGGRIEWIDRADVEINCANLSDYHVPTYLQDIQAGYLFLGPLLARFGKCTLLQSVGCELGYRGYEGHLNYLARFNVRLEKKDLHLSFFVDANFFKQNKEILIQTSLVHFSEVFEEALVTPTENLMMFLSSMAGVKAELFGIATEPHVMQLKSLLRQMGVQIEGFGNHITIAGTTKFSKADITVEPDPIDFFGLAVATFATHGEMELFLGATTIHHGIMRMDKFLSEAYPGNLRFESDQDGYRYYITPDTHIYSPSEKFSKADANEYKRTAGPWPGFAVDALPAFTAWACMNHSDETATSVINGMYERGFSFVQNLQTIGARLLEESRHHVIIGGSSQHLFKGNHEIKCPNIIEGCRSNFILALANEGETILRGIDPLLRRKPDFITDFQKAGADIEILDN